MARLPPKQWEKIRKTWEEDSRTGYQWLVTELKLPVTRKAVEERAKKQQWAKKCYVPRGIKAKEFPASPSLSPIEVDFLPAKQEGPHCTKKSMQNKHINYVC